MILKSDLNQISRLKKKSILDDALQSFLYLRKLIE